MNRPGIVVDNAMPAAFYHCPHCGRIAMIARGVTIVIGHLDFRCYRCKGLFYVGDAAFDGRASAVSTVDGLCPELRKLPPAEADGAARAVNH